MPSLAFPLPKRHLTPPLVPEARIVCLPALRLAIINKANKKSFETYAIIDSGAAANLFPVKIAETIGIKPVVNEQGELFTGIASQEVIGYPHHVGLDLGGHRFETFIYFSPQVDEQTLLLGMRGFFSLFAVKIDTSRERIELTPLKRK